MADTLHRMLQGSPATFAGLGRPQQILLGALGLLLPAVLFFGSQWVNDGQYVPLFASLTAEDAGAIVNQLKAGKTPYRVGGSGDQILVPADKVSELRLRMAVQGLPLGGGVGFEVFDRPALGVSDFTQRLNYQRALGGELARTIGQLREVSRARVHLVLPQPALFADRERPASASVFVKLQPGAQLGREQIRGIVHLVASSVEGLAAERVTVIDTSGRVLSVGGDAQANPLSPRRLELKASVEEGVERRVQTLLDAALGTGQAVTRVSAQINFDQVERTEERYDPQGVARQKTKSVESSKGRSTTPGASPAPDAEKPAPGKETVSKESVSQNEGSRESESVTYELSRTTARTLTAPGEIQRLSVAVLLNTQSKVTVGPDKKEVRTPQPRSAEELEKIRKVVMGAVGFTETRKDEVTVTELPFDTTALERERALLDQPLPPPAPRPLVSLPIVVGTAVGVVLVVAVLFFLLRGRSRQRARAVAALTIQEDEAMAGAGETAPRPRAQAGGMPRAGGGLVAEELMEAGRRHDDIRQKAFTLATAEPDETAQLLRAWLVKKKSLAPAKAGSDGS